MTPKKKENSLIGFIYGFLTGCIPGIDDPELYNCLDKVRAELRKHVPENETIIILDSFYNGFKKYKESRSGGKNS